MCNFSTDTKKHDAGLLSEVRTFEPDALKAVPQKKKNLQNVSSAVITNHFQKQVCFLQGATW